MRAMRRATVSAYTPDGSLRIDAIAQIDGSYKPVFDVPCFDYEWDASLNAFVMWPKGFIRILTGTEKQQ